jgi:hypothetical protein
VYVLSKLLFNFALEYAISKVQEKKVGLNLNATHQILVYVDDVDSHNIYKLHTRKATGISQKYNTCGAKRETTLVFFLELTKHRLQERKRHRIP